MSTSTSGLTTPSLTSQASSAASAASTASGASAAAKLGGNEQTFLKLLMTQIQNQDPTSPMDTNQFTTELVQFSSVEQQISTNTSLNSLIQLTQSGQLLQSSSLVGHKVLLNAASMPVQGGSGALQFTAAAAAPVTITVFDNKGAALSQQTVNAQSGVNSWSWNGMNANGQVQPDGAYKVTATTTDSTGTLQPVPFAVIGTATGLVKSGTSLNLQVGSLNTDVSTVQSVLN